MLRSFVAIDLPDAIAERVAGLQGGVPGARWVPDENFHITLRFVGDIEGHVFDQLADALDRLRFPPFDLTLRGAGHFPPRKEPKSLWIGAHGEELRHLRDRVDRVCVELGLEPERRKFHPHLTIARLAGAPTSRVARFLAGAAMFETEPFLVKAFHLYTSQLKPSGATYTREESFDLQA